jgi:3-hydroxymyristoyl/3-hydroxydecanoyl-(acyl carrier protein) dehydratase
VIFTDRITIHPASASAEASLFVDPSAEFLRDHFPGRPILPALIMLESAVRTATALWAARRPETTAVGVVLDRVARLQVTREVEAGQTLTLRAGLENAAEPGLEATWVDAVGLVDGEQAVRMRFRLRQLRDGQTEWRASQWRDA